MPWPAAIVAAARTARKSIRIAPPTNGIATASSTRRRFAASNTRRKFSSTTRGITIGTGYAHGGGGADRPLVARTLGANEDLTEAICLAHDLGHPAFGHTGETTLNGLMQGHGGFDHQRQTMRIVTVLEDRYPEFPGLNLTYEVREGLVKHDTDYDVTDATGYEPHLAGTLECQLANLADEIAYNTSDLEDGLRSGLLDPLEVRELAIWDSVMAALGERVDCRLDDLLRTRAVRRLIGIEMTDAITTTAVQLADLNVKSVEDVRQVGSNVAGFSSEMLEMNRQLKDFLLRSFYRHPRVMRMAGKAQRLLTELFNAYLRSRCNCHMKSRPASAADRTRRNG